MKKFKMSAVILFGLLCSCSPAAAQAPLKEYFTAKPVICGPIDKIIDSSKNLGEDPLLSADGLTLLDNGTLSTEASKYVFGFNQETGTWTLIELLPDGVQACVIGKGTRIKIYKKEKGINL